MASGPAGPEAPAEGGVATEFLAIVRRLFGALVARPETRVRVDAQAAAAARDLLRRARRRRADLDLGLREADEAHAADMALAIKMQQGNTRAYQELRARLEPVILQRIYAYGLGWNETDLFELVFDRVIRKLPLYRGHASLRSWCGRLAANSLKNWMRDQDRQPRTTSIDGVHEPGEDAAHGLPGEALLEEERATMLRALADDLARIAGEVLSADDWALLQRLIVDGDSYDLLSESTGKSVGALRKRRFDVVRKLRAAVLARRGDAFLGQLREHLHPVAP
jgi:DNA-directed RNA polymerase specialized sigma24 family protein